MVGSLDVGISFLSAKIFDFFVRLCLYCSSLLITGLIHPINRIAQIVLTGIVGI